MTELEQNKKARSETETGHKTVFLDRLFGRKSLPERVPLVKQILILPPHSLKTVKNRFVSDAPPSRGGTDAAYFAIWR